MLQTDFKVYSSLASQLNFQHVPFSKIKVIKYNKFNLLSLQYKKSVGDNEFQISSLKKTSQKGSICKFRNHF